MKSENRFIANGQRVTDTKVQASKTLRREMTEAEARLWEALRRNQLDGLHFRRQQIIDGFVVDFYCHAAGLIVEVDGEIHDLQKEQDAIRDEVLSKRRLKVLRVPNKEVLNNLPAVLEQIKGIT